MAIADRLRQIATSGASSTSTSVTRNAACRTDGGSRSRPIHSSAIAKNCPENTTTPVTKSRPTPTWAMRLRLSCQSRLRDRRSCNPSSQPW